MARLLAGSVQQPFEQRRWDLSRNANVQVQVQKISGKILIEGQGEVGVDVAFPVWFVETPGFSFGGELADNHSPVAGNFPTVSCVIARWDVNERSTYGKFYKGATLAIYTTGKVDQQMWIHWHMEGKAFQNPVGPGDSTDQTI